MSNTVQIVIVAQDKASSPIKQIAGALGTMGKSATTAAQHTQTASLSLGQVAGAALKAAGIVGVAAALSKVGSVAMGVNASLEQSKVAFTNLLGSGDAATGMLNRLKKLAAETPFEFPQLVDATRRMLAFGFAADKVIPLLQSVGNVAAGMGTGAEGISRLTLALGQMQAKGVVRGQELLQLAEAGVKVGDVYAIMAQKVGKSVQDIMAMQEAGELSARDFIAAFQEFADTKFGNMMAEQAKTFTGAMSTIKDSMQMALADGFKPIFEGISSLAQRIAEFTKTAAFEEWTARLAATVEIALTSLGKLVALVSDNVIPIMGTLAVLMWERVIPAFMAFATKAVPAATTALSGFVKAGAKILAVAAIIALFADSVRKFVAAGKEVPEVFDAWGRESVGATNKLTGLPAILNSILTAAKIVIVALGDLFGWLGDVADTLTTRVARGWGLIVDTLGAAGGSIMSWLHDVGQSMMETWSAIVEGVAGAWDAVTEAIRLAIGDIFEKVSPWLRGVYNAVKTVWDAVTSVTGRAWAAFAGVIGGTIAEVATKLAEFFDKLPGAQAKAWATALRTVADVARNGLGSAAEEAVAGFKASLSDIGSGIDAAINGMQPAYGPPGPPLWNRVQDKLKSSWQSLQSTWQSIQERARKMGFNINLPASLTNPTVPVTPETPGATGTGGGATAGGNAAAEAAKSLEDPLAKAAALLEAITGALSGAIEMFGKLAGYKPDMTRFAAGWQTLLGQIKTVITDIGQMLKAFGFEGESGAKSMANLMIFAEVAKGIGDMIGSMADALSLLVKWKSPMKSNLDALIAMVEDIVWAVQQSSKKMQLEALPGAQLMAETAMTIADMIAKVAGAFEYAATFKQVVAGAFGPLADAINRWVKGMVWLAAQFEADGLKAARDMAETAVVIGNMLAAVFAPMAQAAKFKAVVAGGFAAIADSIERWVRGMVWLASKFTEEGLAAAVTLATTAGLIGQTLEQVAEPMKKAAQFPAIPLGAFGNLADAMFRWVQGLAWLAGELEKQDLTMADAAAMSQTAQIIGAALTAIIEPLKAAAEFPVMVAGVFNNLAVGIHLMVSMLDALNTDLAATVEGVLEFAGNLSLVLAPMSDVVSLTNAMLDLGERIADGEANLAGVAEYLNTSTRLAISMLVAWSDQYSAFALRWPDDLEEWGSKLAQVLAPMQTVISTTTGMLDLGEKIADGEANLANVGNYLNTATRMAVAMLTSWADEASIFFIALPDKLEEYAARLSAVLSPFSQITSATSSMIDFAERTADGTANLAGAFALMNTVTRDLVAQMQEWQRTLDLGAMTEKGESVVAEYADKLGKIITPFQQIAQVMVSVHEYARATLYPSRNLAAAITALGGYIEQIVTETAAMASRIGEATIKSAGNAATLLAPVSGFLDGLLGVFTRLSGWKRPQGFEGAVAALASDVNLLVSGIAGIALTDDNKATLKAMGDSLLPVVQAVSEMMNIFQRVKFYAPLDAQKLTRLFADVATFIEQASNVTMWGQWGENATKSWVQGLADGIAMGLSTGELDRRIAEVNAKFAGLSASELEAVYNVTQNYTVNVSGNTFEATTLEELRTMMQQMIDDALAALGYQVTLSNRSFVPAI